MASSPSLQPTGEATVRIGLERGDLVESLSAESDDSEVPG